MNVWIHRVYMTERNSYSYFLDGRTQELISKSGETVVVNRGYFNPKTCANYLICYQVILCTIFYAYLKSVLEL